MNKKLKWWICSLLVGMTISATPYVIIDAFAATAKIAFSDPTGTVGDEVSVTMKFTCTTGEVLGNTDVMLAYDANLLEFKNDTDNASGGAGAIRVWTGPEGKTEMVTTLRFKVLQAGTAAITVTDWEGYDNDGQTLTMEKQGSSSIKLAGLQTSSTDASLQSLQISPGSLTPGFTPAVESYTTTVGLDTDRLTISAKANNDKATVAVDGGSELQEGENTVVCKVTAEDGTTVKNYTILVNRVAGGEGGDGSQVTTPEESLGAEADVLAEIDAAAKKVRIIALPENVEVPAGFKESTIVIGETKVKGWTLAAETPPSYCVFYGMNENGEQSFYRYDLTEKTIQRYFQDPSADDAVTTEDYVKLAEEHNSLLEDFKFRRWTMIGLGAIAGVLAVILIGVLASKGKKSEHYDFQPEEAATPSRVSARKRLSKEERYMMGVEEEYEESESEEPIPEDAYLPELAASAAEEPVEDVLELDDEDDFEFFDIDEKV